MIGLYVTLGIFFLTMVLLWAMLFKPKPARIRIPKLIIRFERSGTVPKRRAIKRRKSSKRNKRSRQ